MYAFLAEVVMLVHLAYVCVVVFGMLGIVIGIPLRWEWIRNPWFRWIHLVMIAIVTVESMMNVDCPLHTWECQLRRLGGQADLDRAFLVRCLDALTLTMPDWAYTPMYYGLAILLGMTFIIAPPKRRKSRPVVHPQPAS